MNMNTIQTTISHQRMEWVDWMKAIGIWLVVLGHFYSVGEHFIYVFHVPLFFAISGFLCKKENNRRIFWKKIWYNLTFPLLLLALFNFLYSSIQQIANGTFEFKILYYFLRNVIFGLVSGFGPLWFVYTLILLKLLLQFCSRAVLYILVPVMLILAYAYNNTDISGLPFFLAENSCYVDVLTAYPFFFMGAAVRERKENINNIESKAILLPMFLCGLLLVCLSMYYNSLVTIYQCNFGDSIWWFLIGAFSGILMCFALSKSLGEAPKFVGIISRGTIIILGFHKWLIDMFRASFAQSYFDLLFALAIVLLLVPIILVVECYFPLLAGKYRIKNM